MFEPWLLLQSILAGIAVAAPVGPMSLLCIQRTLHSGPVPGLAFGAGIAAADGTYAAIGAFGLTAVAAPLLAGGVWWRVAGALVLLYFALRILRAPPAEAADRPLAQWRWRSFAAAYGLTFANPPTILFFAGLFASLAPLARLSHAAAFTLGVFTGSMLWWVALAGVTVATSATLSAPVLRRINRVSGLALAAMAVYALSTISPRVPP